MAGRRSSLLVAKIVLLIAVTNAARNPLAEGDRVCWASSISCGECFYCREKNQPTRCISRKAYGISYNADEAPHLRGGYAEKILLRPGTSIFRVPDSVPTDAVVGAGRHRVLQVEKRQPTGQRAHPSAVSQQPAPFSGHFELTAEGTVDGHPWSSLAPPAQPLQVKQYARLQGVLDCPAQAVVKTVQVRVMDMSGGVKASQTAKL